MNLYELSMEDKVKAFDVIIDKYKKESNLTEFGRDVENVIKFLMEMNKSRK